MTMDTAREELLGEVRSALKRTVDSSVAAIPAAARIAPREAGDSEAELSAFFSEVEKLGGKTRRIAELTDVTEALRDLVKTEEVKKATPHKLLARRLHNCLVELRPFIRTERRLRPLQKIRHDCPPSRN